jgi:hypothetical protein
MLAVRRRLIYPATCNDQIKMMLITLNTQMFLAEATSVAPVLPCWHSFDAKRQAGSVLALAGRSAS